jgi:hypothetical protein
MDFPVDVSDVLDDLTDLELFDKTTLSVNFTGVGAFIDLAVIASVQGTVSIPLLPPVSPLGISVSKRYLSS